MHIAFFNRSFYPDMAATGQLLTELCEDLVQVYGCRVSVVAGAPLLPEPGSVTESHPGVLFQREQYRGIEILRARSTRLPKRHLLGRGSNYLSYFLAACYAGLRLDQPDVVVALTDPPMIGLAAALAARRFRAPLIMTYQDIFPEVMGGLKPFHSEIVNSVLHRVNVYLVQQATRIVTLGETMRGRLIESKGADPAKTVVIPNWADCTAIEPGPKWTPFSVDHKLAESFVVMHAGNIGLTQGLEVVIQAAEYLRDWPDIQVVFVGDGVQKPHLVEQVRRLQLSNVRFLPYQPKDTLRDVFASADVFVISLQQGLAGYSLPSKLYSILAAGRPYVAAVEPSCEVATVTHHYDCGLRVAPDDAKGLAERILTLYCDRALAQRQGERARHAALAFDRRRQVGAYYQLFRSL